MLHRIVEFWAILHPDHISMVPSVAQTRDRLEMERKKQNQVGCKQSEPWVNLKIASSYLGVFPGTLRRWVRENRVPARRTPGGNFRFRLSQLDSLLEE